MDANGFQAMGATDDIMGLGDIAARFNAFGIDALTVDGHDIPAISAAITELHDRSNSRPGAVVARTVKGKGVSYMENNNSWHYLRLTPELRAQALRELGEAA